VIPILSDAGQRIVGYVDLASATAGAAVSVQQGSVVKRATIADTATGRFVLYPVDLGTYDLVINAVGRVTAVMTNVPVVDTAVTMVSTDARRISPATATIRDVSATVSGLVAPVDAQVKVEKALTGGPTVQLGNGSVDPTSGVITYHLPVEAPSKAAYAIPPALPTFTADAAVPSGNYLLSATSGSTTKGPMTADISSSASNTPFVFP
jgi:hypothetical protein